MVAGDVAFVMNWSFAWELANDPDESEIAGMWICLVPGNGTVTSAAVTGGGIGIISTSDSPEYAWKFIEMPVSPDNQKFVLKIMERCQRSKRFMKIRSFLKNTAIWS